MAFIQHTADVCPVADRTVVQIDLGDGQTYVGHAVEFAWGPGAGPEGEGRIHAYRVLDHDDGSAGSGNGGPDPWAFIGDTERLQGVTSLMEADASLSTDAHQAALLLQTAQAARMLAATPCDYRMLVGHMVGEFAQIRCDADDLDVTAVMEAVFENSTPTLARRIAGGPGYWQ